MLNLLLVLLILVIAFGVIFWAIRDLIPMEQPFKNLALAIAALILVVLLLSLVFGGIPVPTLARP